MSRRKGSGVVDLPSGVEVARAKGKTYYYWSPHRGTAFARKRIRLPDDPSNPDFWDALRKVMGVETISEKGTFGALIERYKASEEWRGLKERTKEHYTAHLARIESAWAAASVDGLTVRGIYALRARFEKTPVSANHTVSILRTLLKWGLQHGYGTTNPARDIKPIRIRDENSARPWPDEAYTYVMDHAPKDVRMAVFLAAATGQRRSDIVTLGKRHRFEDGLRFGVSKLRGRQHFIPLTKAQRDEIDSWPCSDTGPWVVSPSGSIMNGDALQSALNRFLAKHPYLRPFGLKMHGLRAMKACELKMLGFDNKTIGAFLCMSPDMVERYTRNIDKVALARRARDGIERTAT